MNNEALKEYLQPLINNFVNKPWDSPAFYEQYLAQTYYYTFHSTRMLAYAAALTTAQQQDYYKRSLKHISEEEGHEKMALTDLKKLGKNIENYTELPTTKAFWQSQYYYINKCNTSLLGYILALEWLAVEAFPAVFQKIKPLYGVNSTHFVRVHGEEDPGHIIDCFKQIDPLSPEERKLMEANFIQTCKMFSLFMDEIELSVKEGEYFSSPGTPTQSVEL